MKFLLYYFFVFIDRRNIWTVRNYFIQNHLTDLFPMTKAHVVQNRKKGQEGGKDRACNPDSIRLVFYALVCGVESN